MSISSHDDAIAPPLEWLEAQLCELAGHLAAATCRFLILLGDFDARQGWAEWDLPSCSAWLSWKCQIAPGTAREHVRVARAMRSLPVISGEFAAGRTSYAKVRALTRIATPTTEADLAELAAPMTASQLERFTRAHRQVSRIDDELAAAKRRVTWRLEDDGSLAMTIRLPAADGAVVLQALRAATGAIEHTRAPHCEQAEAAGDDVPAETPATDLAVTPASLADALVEITSSFLAGKVAAADNPDIYQVIVHVGVEALAGATDVPAETPTAAPPCPPGHPAHPARCHVEDGPAISPAAAQRIACAATVSWMLHDHNGNVLDVGRRHRTPPPALRRAVRERDGYRCKFPGCQSRRTAIHHIRHWAQGGKTKLANLILLCDAHHVIVHACGYLITPTAEGGFTFTMPAGTALPASPQFPATCGDIADCHDATIAPDTIIPAWNGDKLDLGFTIWACLANARIAEERRAA